MYAWLVFFHILGALGFLFGHGVSATVSLRLRYVRHNLEQVRALLDLSMYSLGVMYASLLVLLISGVWAGFKGSWWAWERDWLWLSVVLMVTIVIIMYAIATPYYTKVRQAAGLNVIHGSRVENPPPANEEELEALLTSPRPLILAAVGIGGLAAILYLMVLKPSIF